MQKGWLNGRITLLSGISEYGAGDLVSQLGGTINSPSVRTDMTLDVVRIYKEKAPQKNRRLLGLSYLTLAMDIIQERSKHSAI